MGIKLWKVGDICWAYDLNGNVVRQFVIASCNEEYSYYDLKWISRYDHRAHYMANVRAKNMFHTMAEAIDNHMKWLKQELVTRSEHDLAFQSTEEHP